MVPGFSRRVFLSLALLRPETMRSFALGLGLLQESMHMIVNCARTSMTYTDAVPWGQSPPNGRIQNGRVGRGRDPRRILRDKRYASLDRTKKILQTSLSLCWGLLSALCRNPLSLMYLNPQGSHVYRILPVAAKS